MNRIVPSLGLAVALGAGAFALTRHVATRSDDPLCHESEWLQRDFGLTVAQVATVERLRAEYRARCADRCAAITRLQQAIAAAPDAAARDRATAELAALRDHCDGTTRAHLEELARTMEPAQAERFLKLVTAKLSSPDPSTARPAP